MYKKVVVLPENKQPKRDENRFNTLWRTYRKDLITYAIIFAISFLFIPKYIAEGVKVDGASMENTLQDQDKLITEKITTQFGTIERFDIVIFDPHNDIDKYWIKRIVGLPGETIQIIGENIFINGELLEEHYGKDPIHNAGIASEPVLLGDNEYFVLGDNRSNSTDSRIVGPIKKEDIAGRACFCLWPLSDFGILD